MIPRSEQPSESDCFSDPDEQAEGLYNRDVQDLLGEEVEFSSPLAQVPGSGGGRPVTGNGHTSPADFSNEELHLARTLNTLFNLEQEELPPLFFRTLAGEQHSWVAPEQLEQRVQETVFERLELAQPRRSAAPVLAQSRPGELHLRRASRTIGLSTVFALVLLSLVAVAPSFAHGIRLLLGQGGVQLAPAYPAKTVSATVLTQYLSLREAQAAVPFEVYWLGVSPAGYRYQSLLLHVGQDWADGPVVELHYGLGQVSAGSGRVVIREFRPTPGSTVLLVVDQQAASTVQVAGHPAIYIDGRWVRHNQEMVWEYGTQAELVYEAHGLIFWISADQRDGATAAWLEKMAGSLETLYLGRPRPQEPELHTLTDIQLAAALGTPEVGDVVAKIPAGVSAETGAAVYIAFGQPPDDHT